MEGVFSAGSTVKGRADEVAQGLLRELQAVYAFLSSSLGEEAAKDLLPAAAEAILLKKPSTYRPAVFNLSWRR